MLEDDQELSPVMVAMLSQSDACGVIQMRALWETQPPSVPARGYLLCQQEGTQYYISRDRLTGCPSRRRTWDPIGLVIDLDSG